MTNRGLFFSRLSDWSGGRLIIMAWMKTVFSRIAKDVVGKGPDHGTFVLRLSSKRMLNSGSGFTGRPSWPRAKKRLSRLIGQV